MKVLALNSSPRGKDQSKTELLLTSLVEGMRSENAEVEVIDLRRKKINYCLGCYSCWTKTPGSCAQKDDMSQELLPKFREAEVAVYATPLYYFGVNAQIKAFIERTLPLIQPFFIERDGKAAHELRGRHPLIVALSVAGFPENSVFDQLSSHLRRIYGRALIAEIYRPAAELLVWPEFEKARTDVLDAVKQAGREIVRGFKVSDGTMKTIQQPIIDLKTMSELVNAHWQICIDKGMTPKEGLAKGVFRTSDAKTP